MTFSQLAIGSTFDEVEPAKRTGGRDRFMRWQKVSPSRAKCIAQEGWGNTRYIGVVNPFPPGRRVFHVQEVAA